MLRGLKDCLLIQMFVFTRIKGPSLLVFGAGFQCCTRPCDMYNALHGRDVLVPAHPKNELGLSIKASHSAGGKDRGLWVLGG